MAGRYDDVVRCSFCNKTQAQVRKMIAGPNGVYICDRCVDVCAEIIEEELHEAGIRYNQYSVENEGKMRAEMEAAGVEFHEADRQAFLDMGCGDLVLKYSIGQELLDTLADIRANK